MIAWNEPIEFEWDEANTYKNQTHGVTNEEIESVFFDSRKLIKPDLKHSLAEERYLVIGRNRERRWMYIVVTKRERKIRVISGRYMHTKEVALYEKEA